MLGPNGYVRRTPIRRTSHIPNYLRTIDKACGMFDNKGKLQDFSIARDSAQIHQRKYKECEKVIGQWKYTISFMNDDDMPNGGKVGDDKDGDDGDRNEDREDPEIRRLDDGEEDQDDREQIMQENRKEESRSQQRTSERTPKGSTKRSGHLQSSPKPLLQTNGHLKPSQKRSGHLQ